MNMTIFLIGYMGCGKTTLGAPLAERLGVPFIDLDDYIEERCQATITEIVAQVGMKGFRDIERRALTEVAAGATGAVVACGGGTPLQPGNMELINRTGLSIWLTTTPERIASRLVLPQEKAKRPLVADVPDGEMLERVRRGLQEREPYYSRAQLRFDSTWLESPAQVAATATRLAQLLATLA